MKRILTSVMLALFSAGIALAEPYVVGVEPAAPALPENILRFHILFSDPMREGEFSEHIQLEKQDGGGDVPQVFFDSFYELWSPDRKRLTLIVDPGRVKTGLVANNEMGRAFEAGEQYALRISSGWRNLAGDEIRADYVQVFAATPEIRTTLAPDNWKISLEGRALMIEFDRVIDLYSLRAHVVAIDENDEAVSGAWHLEADGRTAKFMVENGEAPSRLAIRNRFEDVAGNTIAAAFDHKVGDVTVSDERGITFVKW